LCGETIETKKNLGWESDWTWFTGRGMVYPLNREQRGKSPNFLGGGLASKGGKALCFLTQETESADCLIRKTWIGLEGVERAISRSFNLIASWKGKPGDYPRMEKRKKGKRRQR